jgi:hypothetical protein
MATPQILCDFERVFIRTLVNLVFDKPLRNKLDHFRMKIKLSLKPIIYTTYKGNCILGDKLCIFVSFQPNGILPTVWKYLKH